MNVKRQLILSALLFALLIGLIFSFPVLAEEEEKKLSLAPTFSLKDLDGKRVALSDLLGKGPILIDFWATWCKPCIKELPHLNDLYEKYKDRGFLLVAISEDSPRSLSKVKSFIASKKYEFLVLLDDNNAVQRKFNFRALPYTVLLDEDGHVIHARMGYRPGDEKVLEEKLIPLIEAAEQKQQAEEAPSGEEGAEEQVEKEEAQQAEAQGEGHETAQERDEKGYVKKVKGEEARQEKAEDCNE
jgi:peroxiredoxin